MTFWSALNNVGTQSAESRRRADARERLGCVAVPGLFAAIVIFSQLLGSDEALSKADRWASVLSGVAIVFGTARYFANASESERQRRLSSQREAWQTLGIAAGKPGAGGRRAALELLAGDGVVLDGVNLDGAYLEALRLPPGTRMSNASFRNLFGKYVVLRSASLSAVTLQNCDFTGADLVSSLFARADLKSSLFADLIIDEADFTEANLVATRFINGSARGLKFASADASYARFSNVLSENCSFSHAKLESANFYAVEFLSVDLRGADLTKAAFEKCAFDAIVWSADTRVVDAHFIDAREMRSSFLRWASANGATFDPPLEPLPVPSE